MAKTIVGLYNDQETAKNVAKALEREGFRRDQVHTVLHDEKGIRHTLGGSDDLADALSDRGVPEDEAMLYAEGVRRGGALVYMRIDDARVQAAVAIMNQHAPVPLENRSADWEKRGYTGYQRGTRPFSAEEARAERERYGTGTAARTGGTATQEERVPIVEEELKVGKRQVERGGVRIHTHVEEQPVEEQVRVRDEYVDVERRDTDRPLRGREADEVFKEKTIEMTETDEEVVAEKKARVTGEVVARKGAEERTETVRDTVRRTDVDVERTSGEPTEGRFEEYRDDFRSHYRTTYGTSRQEYDAYEPAYRYGYTSGLDERYRGRAYSDVEPELRRSYEERHGRGTFEQVKDAIRHAYDRVRSGVRS